jgi:modulator of FtsH protease HflK
LIVAWNEPGASGDKDPWGGRQKIAAGARVDKLWRTLQEKFGGLSGGEPGSGSAGAYGAALIVVVAAVLWLASGFYVVNQGERAVVQRFGAKHEIVEAGLHWRWPFPIDRVDKVNVQKVYSVEVGYRTNPRAAGKTAIPKEALMLTTDGNILDIQCAVQYRIRNVEDYLFNVRDPDTILRQTLESVVREVIGRSAMEPVMKDGRATVDKQALASLNQIVGRYRAGIEVTNVELQRAQWPEQVKSAFDEVGKAQEEARRLRTDAENSATDTVARARADAARTLQEAEAYKASTIARAEGDARRFAAVATEYLKAPAVTRERLYIETMEQVFSRTTKIFVDQKAGNNVIYLPLDKLIAPHETNAAAPASSGTAGTEPETLGRSSVQERGRTEPRTRGVGQ